MRLKALIAAVLVVPGLFGQEAPLFPKPAYFRHHVFSKPQARVALEPPVKLADFAANGKLELSLRSYLELVMANNTDIAIQRLNIEIPRNNIMRAFGPFDPRFVGAFSAIRQKDASTSVLSGANMLNSLDQRANFTYNQRLTNGTQFSVGFLGTKSSSNNEFATFNPSLTSQLVMGFTQPLIRNRGGFITKLPITVARSQLRKSEYDLRDTVLGLVQQAESAYWDVVETREQLKVQEEYFKLSGEALKRSQRELELGAMSRLDIYRPQQQYATAEIQVSQQKFLLAQREDALRRFIGADLDTRYRALPIVLTETVMPPVGDTAIIDPEEAVAKALGTRPDLKSAAQSLDVDELNIRGATNTLRPDLSLTGGYTSKGRGGMYYERENVFGGGSRLVSITPGGFGDALSQLFGFGVPAYQFGLTLTLPIRDRAGSADLANALVQKRLDAMRVRSLEERVRLDVLNALNQLESAKAGVKLALVAADFAKKQVDAEQQKYDLGTSVMYFVLQAQTDLVNAQSQVVRQSVQYHRSRLNLLRYTGELLDERGIVLK